MYITTRYIGDFENIGLLKSMKELEILILPAHFKSLSDLVLWPSLEKIDARGSAACDIDPILGMPNLETLLIQVTTMLSQVSKRMMKICLVGVFHFSTKLKLNRELMLNT